jgi:hypothetical protein
MKICYETIKKNLDTYKEARGIFPAISQFEESQIDFSALSSLGLGKFGEFHMFLKKNKLRGYEPICEDMKSFKNLKDEVVKTTSTERFKKFIGNRTQKKFNEILTDKDLFDRLLNGAWKSRPKMRRNGQMGHGTRKNERVEGLQLAIVPIINYIILNDLEVISEFESQDRVYQDIKWYKNDVLSFENVPQKEIELTNKLLQTFSEIVEKEHVDFRKLNITYVLSAISTKIKNAMKIPNGTQLKCIRDFEDEYSKKILLSKGKMYEVNGTYEKNGFLTVYVKNDLDRSNYYNFSYFEDIRTKRDDLLSMLLG